MAHATERDAPQNCCPPANNSDLLSACSVVSLPSVHQCRICFDTDDGPMLRPCACRGSIGHVHRACLQEYVNVTGRTVCVVCHRSFSRKVHGYRPLREWTLPHPLYTLAWQPEDIDAWLDLAFSIYWIVQCVRISALKLFTQYNISQQVRSEFGALAPIWWVCFVSSILYYVPNGVHILMYWIQSQQVFDFADYDGRPDIWL